MIELNKETIQQLTDIAFQNNMEEYGLETEFEFDSDMMKQHVTLYKEHNSFNTLYLVEENEELFKKCLLNSADRFLFIGAISRDKQTEVEFDFFDERVSFSISCLRDRG